MNKPLSVVCNSSPIIGLSLIPHLDLLYSINAVGSVPIAYTDLSQMLESNTKAMEQ